MNWGIQRDGRSDVRELLDEEQLKILVGLQREFSPVLTVTERETEPEVSEMRVGEG